jgi:maltose alpha-D-glucosyltransferase/alpha-amylase
MSVGPPTLTHLLAHEPRQTGTPETSAAPAQSQARQWFEAFFSHQPDLNYDNPEVGDAMLDVLRFWLDKGLDGFRLDAVPYLFEREGTNCENLPETHAYLMRVRKVMAEDYPDRVQLAEANQWPADVVQYFGEGDECQMAFHDYMYTEYAKDPRMTINLGIRRRLAPLLDNGRDEIELMTAILFALPGSPVLYGELSYLLTLAPRGFYWFQLVPEGEEAIG